MLILALPKSLDGMPTIYFQAGRVVCAYRCCWPWPALWRSNTAYGLVGRSCVVYDGDRDGGRVPGAGRRPSGHLDDLKSEALAARSAHPHVGYEQPVRRRDPGGEDGSRPLGGVHRRSNEAYACAARGRRSDRNAVSGVRAPHVAARRCGHFTFHKHGAVGSETGPVRRVGPKWSRVASRWPRTVCWSSSPASLPLDVIHAMGFEIRPFGRSVILVGPRAAFGSTSASVLAPSDSSNGSAASGSIP